MAFVIATGALVVAVESRRSPEAPPPAVEQAVEPSVAAAENVAPSRSATRRAALEPDPVPYIEGQLWGDIDLGEVRAVMPDNLYWQLGAPSNDPALLEAREKEKARRNEEYGRVLSGDASEDEVRAYYDYRERLSTDYLELADYVRRRFDSSLSDPFKGMLDLAVKLHTARLAQLPADEAASLEHARERAKIREEWRRQQEEFGAVEPPDALGGE